MPEPQHIPNPLRPYYVPPSIGQASTPGANIQTPSPNATSPSNFSFPNIDYSDYIPDGSPSVTGSVKSLLDQALWKYISAATAQPLEVAKIILQTRVAQEDDLDLPSRSRDVGTYSETGTDDAPHEDSSDDEPNYFTSTTTFEGPILSRSPPRGRRGKPVGTDAKDERPSSRNSQTSPSRITLRNPHSLIDALSALSANSGASAMWRGTNTTFVYGILGRTLETFLRSFLAACFGVAEADVLVGGAAGAIPDASILSSSSPGATILIATAAAAISALVLAPIDAARTRLVLTPSDDEPRSLIGVLKSLSPAYIIPTHLIPITFLSSTLPTLISTSTPVFLKTYLNLDPALNPASWSIATFTGSALDLTLRFPLETVLRRAQISTWTGTSLSPPSSQSKRKAVRTIVPVPQSYRGTISTIWSIVKEEGYSESAKDRTAALMGRAPRRKRKGQGVAGLYRGWRVGLWGLVGVWGSAFVGGLSSGSEGSVATELPGTHGGKF